MSKKSLISVLTTALPILALPLLLLLLWELGARWHWWGSYILPAPERVLSTWWHLAVSGQLARHVGASLLRVLIGFLIAAGLALPAGIFLGLHHKAYVYSHSVLEFLRNVPPLALLPILILWFGIDETSKIIIVVLATFFPIFLNTLAGMAQPDPQLIEMGRVYGLSPWAVFWHIRLPQALPSIYTGLRIGLGYSWRFLIGAEMIAAAAGLGYLILDGEEMARPDVVLAGILTLGVLGILADALMAWAGRCLLWTERRNRRA